MTNIVGHILTTHNLTVFTSGEQITIPDTDPDFSRALDYLQQNRLDEIYALATRYINRAREVVHAVFKNVTVEFVHGQVIVNGRAVAKDTAIVNRIIEFAERGLPTKHLLSFLARVQRNPDPRVRTDVFDWIEKNNMPITADGCFIAFKIVKNDYWDIYTGNTFYHAVGNVIEMPREEVNDNPNKTCSRGAHFCGEGYIPYYGTQAGSRIVTLKIAPEDVVAFPIDYNLAKGRAYKYEVIGELSRASVQKYLGSINRTYWPDEDEESNGENYFYRECECEENVGF